MADRDKVKKAMAFLTDDNARANMPDAKPVDADGRKWKRDRQYESSPRTSDMDAKVSAWLKEHPDRRHLFDADATDPEMLPDDLTPEEVAMVKYGHEHGNLWDEYEENPDSAYAENGGDRSDEYREKAKAEPTMTSETSAEDNEKSADRREKFRNYLFSGEAFRKNNKR